MGINLQRTQLTAFAVGHFYAGIAGALYGWHLQFVATEAFSLMRSIEMLVLITIGGLGSLAGAVLGAGFIVLVAERLAMAGSRPFPDLKVNAPVGPAAFRHLVVLFLIYHPHELATSWRQLIRLL